MATTDNAMESNPPASVGDEIRSGARDTIPLIVGAIPFGIIFGTLAVTNGLSPWTAMAMSLFVFAGSSQFIAVGLLAIGSSPAVVILTTFVVNLRHLLYAASLVPYVRHLSQRWRILLAFGLTDESYAVVANRYFNQQARDRNHWYFLGSTLAMWSNWQLCTLLGISLGALIPDMSSWGLDFAMSVTFIGLVIPYVRNWPMMAAVLVSGTIAVAAHPLPHNLGLILAALCGVVAGVLCERFKPTPEAA
ncbi:AzlC family ABC transporter permease [Aestuariirhabdus sp. Z084]|uniref:AzlC family ABC transporter permease n=1 Tax=Aestuariirhabdus haliotis TaxID=2918751 RepID=UPI00201B381F|nr:AzlC family ABC transporter permease [Aestuariirhabdus haliotis]MCL6415566.1 AzlC family ABC transporter permease [Aestuariirhabdus haliotis]MCL6419229.1 AzlC family ABC transporter permease [Aestuariirhabdus haliotis]